MSSDGEQGPVREGEAESADGDRPGTGQGQPSERSRTGGGSAQEVPSGGGSGGGASASSGGGGFPWGKTCLGCGCLVILLAVCAGAVGVGYTGFVSQRMARQVQDGIEVQKELAEERAQLIEGDEIHENLQDPLSESQVDAFEETIETWRESEAFDDIRALQELEENSEQQSTYQKLSALYHMWSLSTSVRQLGTSYLDAIEEHGGIEEHYERLLRLAAIIAATHEVASGRRIDRSGDATSDEIATLLYEDYDEVQEAYAEDFENLENEKGTTFEKLAQRQRLGVYALSVVPRESYSVWQDLSEKRREQLIETFAWTLGAEHLTFGGLVFPVDIGNKLPFGN